MDIVQIVLWIVQIASHPFPSIQASWSPFLNIKNTEFNILAPTIVCLGKNSIKNAKKNPKLALKTH